MFVCIYIYIYIYMRVGEREGVDQGRAPREGWGTPNLPAEISPTKLIPTHFFLTHF